MFTFFRLSESLCNSFIYGSGAFILATKEIITKKKQTSLANQCEEAFLSNSIYTTVKQETKYIPPIENILFESESVHQTPKQQVDVCLKVTCSCRPPVPSYGHEAVQQSDIHVFHYCLSEGTQPNPRRCSVIKYAAKVSSEAVSNQYKNN
ncbi:hypothetical protein CDIK_2599, partial [Cucumispora dikerogammari]